MLSHLLQILTVSANTLDILQSNSTEQEKTGVASVSDTLDLRL